ncbi:MAG: DeoR/GlpR family DNA-binding transcription regulator, partial [Treponema sp.]|nr:DeoR/GlpR family DNA-binding transcription regulator [Treponema sp.]
MMDRLVRILDLLSTNDCIKVNLLAELLDVSPVTLRRDLDQLEKKGIIRRTHGYAHLDNTDDTGKRIAFSHSIKRKIAKAAVNMVVDGESVMVESGSCCVLFAEELALSGKNAVITTNSAFLANYVCKLPGVKIILLGGYLQPESQVLVGPMTTKNAGDLFFDKFFLGTDGFIPGFGFTGRDHYRVDTALGLAKFAKKIYILTESAKFSRRGTNSLFQLDKITGVITDDKIPKEAENDLTANNVKLIKVSAAEEKIKWRQYPG